MFFRPNAFLNSRTYCKTFVLRIFEKMSLLFCQLQKNRCKKGFANFANTILQN